MIQLVPHERSVPFTEFLKKCPFRKVAGQRHIYVHKGRYISCIQDMNDNLILEQTHESDLPEILGNILGVTFV